MLAIRRKTDEMVRLCQILYAVETCLMNKKKCLNFFKNQDTLSSGVLGALFLPFPF